MMAAVRVLAAALFAFGAAGVAVQAQETAPDTLARVVGRSVDALVADLPGTVVPLAEIVAVALDRNLELEAARTERRLADASLQTEQGLFDPTFTLGWGVARDPLDPGRSGTWSTGVSQTLPWGTELGVSLLGSRIDGVAAGSVADGTDLALTFRQPLLEGLGVRDSDVRAARARRRAARDRLVRAQEEVVVDVEFAYWELAEAEAIQAVLQRSLEIADALLFRNRQLADRDLVPEVDVLTAEGAVALRRAGFIGARRAREDAMERLVFLAWGSGASDRLSSGEPVIKTSGGLPSLPTSAGVTPAALEARALEARRDVTAARADFEGAQEIRRAARRAVLPSLDLDGALASAGSTAGGAVNALDRERSWSLGLSFSQPLLNRRDRGAGLGADLILELRRVAVAAAENRVHLEVRSALRGLQAGEQRYAAAVEAASLVRRQLEAERLRLELGLGDSFRLLETEENAVQAELEQVRARYDLARAASLYRLALGAVLPD